MTLSRQPRSLGRSPSPVQLKRGAEPTRVDHGPASGVPGHGVGGGSDLRAAAHAAAGAIQMKQAAERPPVQRMVVQRDEGDEEQSASVAPAEEQGDGGQSSQAGDDGGGATNDGSYGPTVENAQAGASQAEEPTNDGTTGPTVANAEGQSRAPDEEQADGGDAPRYDDEGNVCTGEDKKKEEEAEADSGAEVEVVPLQIAGVAVHLKAGTEGASVELSKEIGLPGVTYPIYPGVFVQWESKVKLGGTLSLKKVGDKLQAEGGVSFGLETQFSIKGGLPWANVYGGVKAELKGGSKYENGEFGAVSGSLEAALVIGAELKLPFDQKPNMADPEKWKYQGGVKFEYAALKGKLADWKMGSNGLEITWAGGDVAFDPLKAWNDEYARNHSGGGAEGGPGYGPSDTGAGGAPNG